MISFCNRLIYIYIILYYIILYYIILYYIILYYIILYYIILYYIILYYIIYIYYTCSYVHIYTHDCMSICSVYIRTYDVPCWAAMFLQSMARTWWKQRLGSRCHRVSVLKSDVATTARHGQHQRSRCIGSCFLKLCMYKQSDDVMGQN